MSILETAYELGIRSLDTAIAYGKAHARIGAFHRLHPSCSFSIVTKISSRDLVPSSFSDIPDVLADDLAVSSIDALLFHGFQQYERGRDALGELKSNARLNALGISLYTEEEFREVLKDQSISVVQLPCNIFDSSDIKRELIQTAAERGVEVHTRSLFLQGALLIDPEHLPRHLNPLGERLKVMTRKGVNLHHAALWHSHFVDGVSGVIIGVQSAEELKGNLSILSGDPIEIPAELTGPDLPQEVLNPSLWPKMT